VVHTARLNYTPRLKIRLSLAFIFTGNGYTESDSVHIARIGYTPKYTPKENICK